MTEQLQEALTREASKQGAVPVDPDVFRALHEATKDLDPSDSDAIAKAVKSLTESHPALFCVEKPWGELSDTDFAERERSFRAGLRRSTPIGPNPFKDLDSALLDPDQLQSLDRVLSGRGSSYDRSVLTHALAQQRQLLKETQ
jgi:hypothetical protein